MSLLIDDDIEIKKQCWPIIDRLADVILTYVQGCLVEIGVGYSTQIFAKYSKKYNRKYYGCDRSGGRIEFQKQQEYTHDGMEFFHGMSSTFMDQFEDTPAMMLIDGNHFAVVVREEVHFFIERMAVGGVIFMHDTMPREGRYEKKLIKKNKEMDTYKVRQELVHMPHIETFTWPYSSGECGLTMVLKKDMSRKFYRL